VRAARAERESRAAAATNQQVEIGKRAAPPFHQRRTKAIDGFLIG